MQVHAVMLASPNDPHSSGGGRGAPMDTDDVPAGAGTNTSGACIGIDSASAHKLGEALLSLEQSLHKDCVLPAYGTTARRASWRRFVRASTGLPMKSDEDEDEENDEEGEEGSRRKPSESAVASGGNTGKNSDSAMVVAGHDQPQPCAAMAAVLLLEGMVRAPWLRAFWRLWSLPLPEPEGVRTWAAVWHRLIMLRSALRVGSAVPRGAELALFKKRGGGRSARRGASGVSGASGSGAVSTADGGHREVTGGKTTCGARGASAVGGTSAAGASSIAKGLAAPAKRVLAAEIDLSAIQFTSRTRNKTRVDYTLAGGLGGSDSEEEGGGRRGRRGGSGGLVLSREERAKRRDAARQEDMIEDEYFGGRSRRSAPSRGAGVRVTRAAAAGGGGRRSGVVSSADEENVSEMDTGDGVGEGEGDDAQQVGSDGDAEMMSVDGEDDAGALFFFLLVFYSAFEVYV